MRHKMGNSPKCYECYFYQQKSAEDKTCRGDGWCANPYEISHGINGRKRERPLERVDTCWNDFCDHWEDAECRATRFEVLTRKVGEWRKGLDRERILQELKGVAND